MRDMAIVVIDLPNSGSQFVADALSREGFPTALAADFDAVTAADAFVLLVGAEASEASALIGALRARHPAIPQMVVADRDDVDLRVAAYEAGADDCLSRPFHLRELVAKLRALTRRAGRGAVASLLPAAAAVIDVAALELTIGDSARRLTKREADLLVLLCKAGGGVVRREDVLRDAWGAPAGVTGNLVDVYVGYVRRKLDEIDADVSIKSVRGEGFRLVERRTLRPRFRPDFDQRSKSPSSSAL